ncbi:succinate--hydroxymethylglutarate CoA-transferase isoform X3 [Trichosurus vulpecula]|uniref:succinate--hydroxymethylglutarate CoA-transferase isoform X3 n=1 Tax=Trichosurus vulpecula TaxID=9337 RepID=UPI00186B3ACF|nr:succinate--hydroxymethylglutarate CoA-transferase isoform X3 [Trichosurus vulpecula]
MLAVGAVYLRCWRRSCVWRSSPSTGPRRFRSSCPSPDINNVKPLDGVKILDLTRVLAGPFATMNLGDLGAEVIKVERPGAGDDTRTWGPPFVGSESTYFLSVNRNKKSIAINIKDPKGVQIVQKDGDPVRPGVAMTDLATGLYSYGAIMAGLLQRYKTGRGLHIDCNLLSSQVACLTQVAANYLIGGKEAKRWGTAHGSIVPYQAFRTKDGYLVVGAGNDQQFVTICKILNLPTLISDSRYKSNHLRVQNRKELLTILSARFVEEMTSTWLRLFEGSGIPYGPINSVREVFAEPQVLHNGLIMEMDHPTVGRISVPGPAVRYSGFTMAEPKPPPLLGQHTVEVLKTSLGYDDSTISDLLHAGVVAQAEVK